MSELSIITLAAANAYTNKAIESVNPDAYLGVTTTPLSDGSTTNPITIDEKSVTAKSGQIVAYSDEEFIFNGTTWRKFGGTLAGLTDVNINNPTNGQFQRYSGTTNKWENVNDTKQEKPTILTGTLTAGNTSVSWTNAAITNTARYEVFTDPYIPYEDLTRSGTTFTALFEEQTGDVAVELVIYED